MPTSNAVRFHIRRLLAMSATAAIAMPSLGAAPALAATSPASGPANAPATASGVLEEIVVTASKREQRLQDAPASIVAETGADLQQRGATQLQDIVDNTPGLVNPGAAGANQANLVIRGVTTGTGNGLKQATVALLYDDIPLDPGAQGGGTTNLRVVDVERVEVLRGPQGTLFGSGSLSGAIRYVTNKPDFEAFGASAELTGATTASAAASYSGAVTINAPLADGRFALRATAYRFEDGGWVDEPISGRRNINDTVTTGGRITLGFRPGENLRGELTAMYQKSTDEASGGSLYTLPSGDDQVTDGLFEVPNAARNAIAGLNLQYDFAGASLTSQSTYHDRTSRNRGQDRFFVPLTTGILTGFAGIVEAPDDYFFAVDAHFFTQELRLASRGDGPVKWTVGAFYLDSKNEVVQLNRAAAVVPFLGSDVLVDLVSKGTQKELAAFGQVTRTFADRWDLTAGVRASDTKVAATTVTGGFLTVFAVGPDSYVTTAFREHDTPLTPHVSLTWRPNADLSLYAAAARGFRIGNINLTAGIGGRDTPTNYSPDSLWNYEIGAKGRGLEGRLVYATALYFIDWKNIQTSLANNLGNYTGNAGRAHLYGFEGQVDVRPVDWFEFGASLSLADSEIVKGVSGLVTSLGPLDVEKGDVLPASPKSKASAYAQYNFRIAAKDAYVRLQGRHVGEQWTVFDKTGSRFGNFQTADLRAGVHLGQWELAAFCNNLFDSDGFQSAADASSVGPVVLQNQMAWRVRPRTVGFTARVEF